jgi:hypothetical protein
VENEAQRHRAVRKALLRIIDATSKLDMASVGTDPVVRPTHFVEVMDEEARMLEKWAENVLGPMLANTTTGIVTPTWLCVRELIGMMRMPQTKIAIARALPAPPVLAIAGAIDESRKRKREEGGAGAGAGAGAAAVAVSSGDNADDGTPVAKRPKKAD